MVVCKFFSLLVRSYCTILCFVWFPGRSSESRFHHKIFSYASTCWSFFQLSSQLMWLLSCRMLLKCRTSWMIWYGWNRQLFHPLLRTYFPSWWFYLLQWSLISLLGLPNKVEENFPQINVICKLPTPLIHPCCSDRHASPHWGDVFIVESSDGTRLSSSMNFNRFHPFTTQKTNNVTIYLFGPCFKAELPSLHWWQVIV